MPMTPQEMIKLLKKNGFEVVSQKTPLLGYSAYVLYKYNDFFRTTLYQYKALDDYALKDVFLENFPELKKV